MLQVITEEMGKQLADACQTRFCEISAKTGDNLSFAIKSLGRLVQVLE